MPLQELKEGLIPRNLTYKRPLVKKPSVEFICIHDTGDNKFNASDWKEEVTTSERPTSWHFTVDDYEIYQHVPLDEVARHAGDGTGENLFKLTDTGVKYSGEDPELEFNTKDHHLYINGEKSENIMAIEDKDGWHHSITPAGLYITKGDNGNYFINNFYYNPTYEKLSNGGGNYNSIGIESCIFDGVSYSKVMRKFANLVAHLLNIYKLGTDRVMQHRNFSGKMCPQSMIRANEKSCFAYKNFKTLIEEEAFILNNFHDLKFEYFSNNPDIMDNNGFLLKYVEKETKISYTARVEVGEGQAVVKTFYTTIHPISKENRERMERMEKLKYMEK
ncbi:MAG: N-acetylmuramoyl-L-alanine amidase [archaeon]|nr:N-acetylmuramoyl-L-alanine amidase [archaeon]